MTKLEEIRASNAKVQGLSLETKSSRFSPFVSQQLFGGGGFNSLSPSFAFWLYENSDSVGDAIDRIAWVFSQITPILKDLKTGETLTKPTDHPFLALLNKPSFSQNSQEFKFELMVSFCATGNCFPEATGNVKFEPLEVKSISANKASLVTNGFDELHQIYFSNSDNQKLYARERIPKRGMYVFQDQTKLHETVQIKIKKKKTGVQALSPLERIVHQAMTKHYGTVHNESLLEKGSRPGGMWSPDSKEPMSQQQYEAFKNEVRGMSGAQNAGKDIIAPVPIKYENFLLTSQDMDFIKLIEASKEDVYNQYQIPLPMVSSGNMTMGNYTEAQTAFLDLSAFPRISFLLNALGEFLLPRYKDGDRYELTYDIKTIPAIRKRMLEEAGLMSKVNSFSDNEIRTTVGYESVGIEGDIIYKPANLIAVGDDDYTSDNITKPDDE